MEKTIIESLKGTKQAADIVLKNNMKDIERGAELIINALKKGNKLMICGNGGSASQSQHFAAELIVRFEKNRRPLAAIALTTDTSNITACGNDFSFQEIFSRQVEALGNKGDVLIGLTTSGNSENVLKAFESAEKKGITTICLNGKDGGKASLKKLDLNLIVKVKDTSRIQEMHITIIHIWCKLLEQEMFKDD